MQLQEVQSLDTLITEAITNAITSEAIAKRVQAAAEKAVAESIDAAFGYNSDFRKGIQRAISEILPITKVDDLAVFSHAVREVLQRRLCNLASETAAEHLGTVLESLLPDCTVISIDDLKQEYIDKLKESASRHDCSCEEDHGEPEFAWNEEHGNHDKYWDIWMSPDPDASRYGGKDVVILRFRPIEGSDGLHECWNASVGGHDSKVGSIFCGPLYGFDAMVFRLATGTAKLKK